MIFKHCERGKVIKHTYSFHNDSFWILVFALVIVKMIETLRISKKGFFEELIAMVVVVA